MLYGSSGCEMASFGGSDYRIVILLWIGYRAVMCFLVQDVFKLLHCDVRNGCVM